jgi:hypothetical protein
VEDHHRLIRDETDHAYESERLLCQFSETEIGALVGRPGDHRIWMVGRDDFLFAGDDARQISPVLLSSQNSGVRTDGFFATYRTLTASPSASAAHHNSPALDAFET